MSNKRSPIYTVLAVLFSVIVIGGGVAKLYRGYSQITQADPVRAVRELLEASDKAAAEANRKSEAVAPAFDEILGDFDRLGIEKFRAEKRDASTDVIDQFGLVSEQLERASTSLKYAGQIEPNEKMKSFIESRSKSYDLLVEANQKNIEIVRATMDPSLADVNAVLTKIESLVASRTAIQKESLDASAAADELLKQK